MSEQNDTCTECKGTGIDSLAIFPNDDPCFACNGTGKESVHQQRKAEWARKRSRTVYVATSGSYSDYHIVAIFDDKDVAERYVRVRNQAYHFPRSYPKFDLEEYTLNPTVTDRIYSERWWYHVDFWNDNEKYGPSVYLDEEREHAPDMLIERIASSPERFGLRVWVEASTREQAAKIAQDKRAEYLAAEFGIS